MAKSKSHDTNSSRPSRPPKKKVGKDNKDWDGARKWAQSAHPNVVILVHRFAEYLRIPPGVYEAPFWPTLKNSLSDLDAIKPTAKIPIDISFLYAASHQWDRIQGVWDCLLYSGGLAHGNLWAREHATTKELSRLKSAVRDHGWWSDLRNGVKYHPPWTPAHVFLSTVRDKVEPEDAESCGMPPLEHEEFEEFWQRFTSADLEDPKCNLYHPKYIEGFVDGALNLSGELKNKFSGTDTTTAQKKTARKRAKASR